MGESREAEELFEYSEYLAFSDVFGTQMLASY